MGRYSRKDMIEFANFAKSYQSHRKVSEAYKAYLKGERLHCPGRMKIKPVMYDRFIYKDREYMVWAVYPSHVDGRAMKIDGKQQTVTAKIDECEWPDAYPDTDVRGEATENI